MGCKGHKMLFWSMAYLQPTKRWFSKEMVFNQIGGSFCKMVICATFHISNTKDFLKPCFEIYCVPRVIFRMLWEFLSSAPKWSIFHLPYYNYIVLAKWPFSPLFKFSSFYEYYVFFRFFFLIEQLNVIIGSLCLLFTAFYFQFCLRDTEKKKRQKNYRWAQENGRFCFFQNVCMGKLRVFCVNMHCNLQYGSQNKLNYRSQT